MQTLGALDLPAEAKNLPLRELRDLVERQYVRAKLDENDWNISRTAQVLGLERTNLHKKMRSLGIARDDRREA
jgi:DNA-binding NtrC family response regulator